MPRPIIVSKPFEVTAGNIVDPTGELEKYNTQGADIPSAASINLGAATGDFVRVTGTTNISSLGIASAGIERTVQFTGALKLIYNSASLILPAAADLQTAPNDMAIFRSRGGGNWICANFQSASGAPPIQLTPDDIGLGNVENVALSTWPGSANITTVGTITSGVWQGSPIAVNKGGTGQSAIAQGDLLYGFAQNDIRRLPKNVQASRYLKNQGPLSDNSPEWGLVDLTNGVTGVLPGANGGRGANVQNVGAPTGVTATIDMALGNTVVINLGSATGNVTLTITNATPGLLNYMQVSQGGTMRSLLFPIPTLQPLTGGRTWNPSAANRQDVITFYFDGFAYIILGTAPDIG